MQDKELIANYIEKYADLKRILNSDDPKAEAAHQLKIIKIALESMGVVTTPLDSDE
ncbi:MAG: hypothetical protein K2N56_04795 [Oscillospiraceae bacterium]|nr:hypothetical protein [Oscillospiraceae bacterium]